MESIASCWTNSPPFLIREGGIGGEFRSTQDEVRDVNSVQISPASTENQAPGFPGCIHTSYGIFDNV